MTKKCICQICTCGRHKCPHNATNWINDSSKVCEYSEYANEFKKHPVGVRQNFKPEQHRVEADGPLDDRTTNKVDYINHEVKRTGPVKHNEIYQKPEGEMDTMTNYHHEYTKKSIPVLRPIKQPDARKLSGKFNGEATYSVDYKKWEAQPRERRAVQEVYEAPNQPFEGNSNYQSDFAARPIQPKILRRPADVRNVPDGPFDGATNYNADFVKHPVQARELREKTSWRPNEAKLDDESNYKRDFNEKKVDRAANYKPNDKAFKSEQPFDSDSTQRVDYQPWQATRQLVRHQQPAYARPEENMDLSTTTGCDYTRKIGSRSEPLKPIQKKISNAKFDGTTNYNADYLKWEGKREPMRRYVDEYVPPDGAFDGAATYQADYVPHQVQRVNAARPMQTDHTSKAPLDGSTEYNKEFIRKAVAPCPALPLIDGGQSSSFTYRADDTEGHRWYNAIKT